MTRRLSKVQRATRLRVRERDGHKGDYGRVLIVGGSRGMVGAVALASNAALRGGAGLVTFAAPAAIQLTVAGLCPCATSVPLPVDGDGQLTAEAVRVFRRAAEAADVIAVGPGMAVGGRQKDLLRAALEQTRPLVIDADGLNNLTGMDDWPALRRCPLVLTPHPGEFARLTGRAVADIQADRVNAAAKAVDRWIQQQGRDDLPPLVGVLKGAGTVVTDGRGVYVNDTGNPGMATGGSGDVLTGLIAALLAQVPAPFDAAVLGVWAHGRAGDLAARQLGETSLMASDLLDYLSAALRQAVE